MKNLSNIELFNKKYRDRTPIVPTVSNDSKIVETVDTELREHATIVYKLYKGNGINTHKGWRSTSYRCKYCPTKKHTADAFVKHLETCKGLSDD